MTINEILEKELERIERLSGSLSAMNIIRREAGHWDYGMWIGGSRGGNNPGYYENETNPEWIVDEPEIAEPDTKKREAAKDELKRMYDSSNWYSARYGVGKAIDIPKEKISSDLGEWVSILSSEVGLPRTRKVKTGEHEEYCPDPYPYDWNMKYRPNDTVIRIEDFKDVPIEENIPRISKARDDLRELYDIVDDKHNMRRIWELVWSPAVCKDSGKDYNQLLLEQFMRGMELGRKELERVYKNRHAPKDKRFEAGKELGHSGLRAWARAHDTGLTICAVGAIASYAGYSLFSYLCR